MASPRFNTTRFAECSNVIAEQGRELAALGWTPATSSNFSVRLDDQHAAITISGRDKGRLTPADIMVVDFAGNPVETTARPSAETLLHTHLYARYEAIGAVLHTHSLTQTLASRVFAPQGKVVLEGYELLKAFQGMTTHDTRMEVPVFANTQDMPELVEEIEKYIADRPISHGYLIDGHGIYAWGRTMNEARRHLDAFEFLLRCELELLRIHGPTKTSGA
jgi:methylthioribulose-1-phosphate dehydratase